MTVAAASRLNVLFVDDDPLILQGLQRMLRTMRNDWAMSFVESGAKALESMAAEPCEVVVSDMRMPGMNGAELLSQIKERYPKTVRLILSGHADKELILQCVGTAHQFLLKPSDPETIRSAIARASAFNSSVKSEQIRKLIVGMDTIPSIPAVYAEVVELLKKEDVGIDEVGAVISKDLAITAKLLKLVNSAFFGLCRQVSSPSEAAVYLGIDTLKSLVLGVNAFARFDGIKTPGVSIEKIWAHSLEVGAVARKIIESEDAPKGFAEESFVAGLLHDIGKVVMATNLPDYQKVLTQAAHDKMPLFMAEEQAFGANHADVAGYLLSLWGLPTRVVDAISHHHQLEATAADSLNPMIAVHVADAAVHRKMGLVDQESLLRMEFLESMGMNENVNRWMNLAL
jgi:putative nucleotidyltransferase with HDIG domain